MGVLSVCTPQHLLTYINNTQTERMSFSSGKIAVRAKEANNTYRTSVINAYTRKTDGGTIP